MRALLLLLLLAACGPSLTADDDSDDSSGPPDAVPPRPDAGPIVDAIDPCPPPPVAAGFDVQLAPQYESLYATYDLGTVPGVPNPLGGAAIAGSDPTHLLIAGGSESSTGAIYSIEVSRNTCGHITGFVGTASQIAATPYVDANLVYAHSDLLVYTEWPQFGFSQLSGAATTPSRQTDLRTLGMPDDGDSGPGGVGFVPPGLDAQGELRVVSWPAGRWYHVPVTEDAGLLTVGTVTQTVTLPNNPGGFAYVPAGSPGFDAQAIIVAEWVATDPSQDRVAVYDADPAGDPLVDTRREFFTRFPRPWGAYFEPVTGDYLFLSWGTGSDHVYIVQGFAPPPVID
jgi:hypothetical protein